MRTGPETHNQPIVLYRYRPDLSCTATTTDMTPHVEKPAAMTLDGAPTTGPDTNTMSDSNPGLRYTSEELTKLRPTQMSPTASLQPSDIAEAEKASHIQTSAKSTVLDIKAEAEQSSESTGESTAVVIDKGGDDDGLGKATKKRPSIAEGMEADNEAAAWPTDTQGIGPGDSAPVVAAAKKKKKKSSGKKKKPNPTGFEEFYADPPITPEDHKEEVEQLYHL